MKKRFVFPLAAILVLFIQVESHATTEPVPNFDRRKAATWGVTWGLTDFFDLKHFGISSATMDITAGRFNFYLGVMEDYLRLDDDPALMGCAGMDIWLIALRFGEHVFLYSGPGGFAATDFETMYGFGARFPIGIEYYLPPTIKTLTSVMEVEAERYFAGETSAQLGDRYYEMGWSLFCELIPSYHFYGEQRFGLEFAFGFRIVH